MALMGILIDGIRYSVRVSADTPMHRAFTFVDGGQGGRMQSGLDVLDTIGTAYSYTVSIRRDPASPGSYDDLWEVVSSPNREHTVTLPYGASHITFTARVEAGGDELTGRREHDWNNMTITFTPLRPQRMAEA